jgi:hypothetical protein
MFRLPLFFGFIILFCNGITVVRAQSTQTDAKYIEVTISDSAEINPDQIEYKLKLNPETNIDETMENAVNLDDYNNQPANPNYADVLKKSQEESALKIKMLEKRFSELLSKEKIPFTREDESGYYNRYSYSNDYGMTLTQSFVLKFSSFDHMNKFLEKMPKDIKYTGFVTNISNSKQREHESALLERTLGGAKKQAETIANLSNVKLGNVIQFSDNEGDNLVQGLERIMLSIPKIYEREKYFRTMKKIVISKTVRVRYSIE